MRIQRISPFLTNPYPTSFAHPISGITTLKINSLQNKNLALAASIFFDIGDFQTAEQTAGALERLTANRKQTFSFSTTASDGSARGGQDALAWEAPSTVIAKGKRDPA
jgi:hypothetical protein